MLKKLEAGDPRSVGPYRLLGRLGSGGMGHVFLGRSVGGRALAVKVIRPELAGEPGFRVRFAREVAAARNVGGLFTALVVDADTDGPVPWLATAYVAGPSLAETVEDQGPLPAASVLALAAGLAEGLQAVHAAGVVHRDLKPSNVLLADDGPRVIDFGISRAAEASMLTQSGTVIGSPGFMSPEQAEGAAAGPPSDIFSLGAVLAFAATGEGPFGTGSAPALIYRVVHADPDTSRLPEQIRRLVESCLAKDPGARPTTGDLLAEVGVGQLAANWLPDPMTAVLARYALPRQLAGAAVATPPDLELTGDTARGRLPSAHAASGPPTATAASRSRTPTQAAAPAKPIGPASRPPRRNRRRLAWTAAAVIVVAVSASVAALSFARAPRPHLTAPSSPATSGLPGLRSPVSIYAQAVIADHPIAYWQFNDAAGSSRYADSSGHGDTLSAGLTTIVRKGMPNMAGAISTAGGGTYTTQLSPLAGDGTRTVEAWFRTTTSTGCILSAGSFTHAKAFVLCLRDGPVNAPTPGVPGFYFATYDADIFIPIPNLADGNWHYLALTLTGSAVQIILDGTQPQGYIWNGNPLTPGGGAYSGLLTQPFTLPYTPDTASTRLGLATSLGDLPSGLVGTIGEVAVYSRALPVQELVKHYLLLTGG